jgi:deoxyadenosine/deoxycytidine kinase
MQSKLCIKSIGRPLHLGADGLIGIGKTRLGNSATEVLKRNFGMDARCIEEVVPQKLLALFYGDPAHEAFATQIYMLSKRQQVDYMLACDKTHGILPHCDIQIWDRTMEGDYCFALLNHLSGNISEKEFEVYESLLGWSILDDGFNHIDVLDQRLLIVGTPTVCKSRVENMRKNKSENGIPLDYYERLDSMHFNVFVLHLMRKMNKSVKIMHTSECESIESAWKAITMELLKNSNTVHQNLVKYDPDTQLEAMSNFVKIYPDEESVKKAYNEWYSAIDERAREKALGADRKIYIRLNMMCEPFSKENKKYGNLMHYQTAYIHLVYAHLMRCDQVVFF